MKARPLAMVLPEDAVTHATLIAATLCAIQKTIALRRKPRCSRTVRRPV
jgi:hypothetical protein